MLSAVLLVGALLASAYGWETVTPLPSPRYSGAAIGTPGSVYHIGGSVVGGVKTRSLFRYDVDGDSWSACDSMLEARHRFGAAQLDGKIYVFGGWGNSGLTLKTAECYDTATGTWTPIETLAFGRGSLMGAAANGRVYAIGGKDAGGRLFGIVEEYDPQTGHWQRRADMPTPRCEGMAGSVSEYVVVIGGTDNGGTRVMNTVELYNAAANSWSTLESIPTARCATGCAFYGPNFLVYGGIGPGLQNSHATEWFYLPANHWDSYDPIPSSRRFLTAAADYSRGYIYAIGGLDSLLQPTALVERCAVPLAVQEDRPRSVGSVGPAQIVRAGSAIRPPADQPFTTLDLLTADGRRLVRLTADSDCPDLAPGLYLVRWTRPDGLALTSRLVIAD